MINGPLTERETLPYAIVYVTLSVAVTYDPSTVNNLWDGVGFAWSIAITIMGMIYVYNKNLGALGQHFLQRYFAIGWVIGIRWVVFIVAVAVVFYGVLEVSGIHDTESEEDTTWYDFVFIAIAEAGLWWRIGHHIEDLVNRTEIAAQE